MTLFSCAVTITWWIVKLTPIPRESRRNPVTHKITEKMSACNVELWRVQIIMQKPRGVGLPHSIKTSIRRCWMQRETRRSALPTSHGSPHGFKHLFIKVSEQWGRSLRTWFPWKQFCGKSKRDWKKKPTLLCSHYQVIWSSLSALVMTCYFNALFYFMSAFSCPAGNINSCFELLINVS